MRVVSALAGALCVVVAGVSAAVPGASVAAESARVGAGQKVLATADLGQRASDPDSITFTLQRSASPIVSVRAVFFGATASLRPHDLGLRLGSASMGTFSRDLRAPRKRRKSGIAVLVNDDDMRVSLKLGAHPQLNIRGTRRDATAEVKPGYSSIALTFSTRAGRRLLAPKPGCTRSGARFDATLKDGTQITKTAWTSCAT